MPEPKTLNEIGGELSDWVIWAQGGAPTKAEVRGRRAALMGHVLPALRQAYDLGRAERDKALREIAENIGNPYWRDKILAALDARESAPAEPSKPEKERA